MRRQATLFVIRSLIVITAPLGAASAAEWPHLRGPNQDGRAIADSMPPGVAVHLAPAWKAPLGPGYSGIGVGGGRVVTLFSDGKADWAIAFDERSGKEAWRYRLDDTYKGHDGSDDGPLSTPAVAGDAVYVLGAHGQLAALTLADGKVIWSRSLPKDFGAKEPEYGFTTAPLVEGDLLIVQTGGPSGKGISGLDRKTGATVWSRGEARVDYQSPVILELAGVRQIVAASDKRLEGLSPRTGEVLWEHVLGEEDSSGETFATFAGPDRFLIHGGAGSVVFQVEKGSAGLAVKEVYRTAELGNNYALPVYHDGHLYGFRGNFLTCVTADKGERVWRSRPPGGRGLILVGGQLAVFGAEGSIVLVEATPAGYKETARLKALAGSGYTWPSFAGGRILVRNLEEIAAVAIAPGSPAAASAVASGAATTPGGAFGRFLAAAQAAPEKDRNGMVDAFVKEHQGSPIVEGKQAHFIFRDKVEDLAVSGTMIATGLPEPMQRLEGTDFYHRTYELPAGGRWEYQYNVNYGERRADPLNPRSVPGFFGGTMSEFTTPGYKNSPATAEPAGRPRGEVEKFTYKSASLGNERQVSVYLPPGYKDSGVSYPLLVVHQGSDWLAKGKMANVLDNLIPEKVAPIVVAFVDPIQEWWFESGGTKTEAYAKMLAEELVPYLEGKYRLTGKPQARAVMGTLYTSMTAVYVALKFPQVFGQVAVQSFPLGLGTDEALFGLVRGAPRKPVRIYFDWNRYESRNVDSGFDVRKDSQTMAKELEQHGYTFVGGEVLDSAGWGGWPSRAEPILLTLFPAAAAH